MPTYSYRCKDCGHEYDAFQTMKEDPHTICPECKGKVERLIGAGAGILFRGSGFYVTDYKSKGNGAAQSTGKPMQQQAGSGSERSEEKSTETSKPSAADKDSGKSSDAGSATGSA